jgi:DNA-binding NarL/FixJ family response regulator
VANAGRHADPTRVEVRLRAGAEGLVLDVIDDGVGFAVEAGESRHGHFGLRGMPGMNGIETVRRLRTCDADARLLMLTSSENQEDIIAAIDAGASGDMTKGTRYGDLVAAVREVHDGGRPLGEVIARKLASRDRGGPLTPRELEVLHLLREGLTFIEIGHRLAITERTARAHVGAIKEKLGATNTAQAVAKGFERGLLKVPPGSSEAAAR